MADFDNTDRYAYITLGAMAGIAGGVALGMLLAPRSGAESREQLRQKAADAREKAMNMRDKAKSQLSDRRDELVDNLSKASEKSSQLADSVNQTVKKRANQNDSEK